MGDMREAFEKWRDEAPNQRCGNPVWDAWQAACANEIDSLRLLGYIEEVNKDYDRAAHIYIVDEDGFDGCTVPVFVWGE